MRKGWTALLAGAIAIAALAGGCGSESVDSAASAKVVAKPLFKKEAEAVCDKTYDEIKGEYEKFVEGRDEPFTTLDEVDEYAEDVILPHRQQELEEWKELGAPKGDEDKIQSMIEAYEEGIEVTEENHARAVVGSASPFNKANTITLNYGLVACKYG